MSVWRRLAGALLGAVALLGLSALLIWLGGYSVGHALVAMWSGSLGSWYALTSSTLLRSVPLMLSGCAVAIAFRASVFNIGAEGQLLLGATFATGVGLIAPAGGPIAVIFALIAGAVGGALWAGIAAVLRARFGVLEVISTIMLNFIALYLVGYLVRGPLQEPTHAYPQSSPLPDAFHLARIPGMGRLHVGILVAVAVLLATGWLFRHSAAGFRIIAVGESAAAARSAGLIDVERVTSRVLVASGAMAGLAGALQVLGVTFALYEDISPGYGYTAIAVALLAGLDAWMVIPSAVLFAALEAGGTAMQRDANVPSTLVSIVEALLILAVLWIQRDGRWARVRSLRKSAIPAVDSR